MENANIKTGSMRNPAFDAWFVFFPLSLAFILAVILTKYPEYTVFAIASVFWISSNTHAVMTYTKAVWDKPNRKKYIHYMTWIPLLQFSACIAVSAWAGAAALVSVYFYLQLFHYVRQSYGLSTIYKKLSVDETPSWLHQGALYMLPLWGVLLAMEHGFFFFSEEVYSFNIGKLPLLIFGFCTITTCALWLLNQVRAMTNKTFSLWYFLYMLSHFMVFYISLFYFEDRVQGWICVAFWHGIQYVLFIWNHFQHISNKDSDGEVKILKFMTKNIYILSLASLIIGGLFIYALKIILGSTVLWAVPVFFALMLTLNFNHYLIDAIIWRRPKNKTAE